MVISAQTNISVATLQSLAARPEYNTRLSAIEKLCRALHCDVVDLLQLVDSVESE